MSRIAAGAPGARAGRRPRGPGLVTLVPVVVAAVLIGLAVVVGPASTDPTPAAPVRLDRGTYACPGGLSTTAGQLAPSSAVTATSLPLVRSGDATPAAPTTLRDLAVPDRWRTASTPEGATVVAQRGRATGAVGFVAGTSSRASGGGLVVGACPAVGDGTWLTGLGSGGKHQSTLVLTNVADTPAVASIRLWNAAGPVEAVDGDSIVVPAGSTRRVRLADLAAGERLLAAHVVRRRGALAVTALDTSTAVYRGSELTSGGAAGRDLYLPGLVSGARGRTLSLVNPGDSTARIRVTAFSAKGSFVPEGLDAVKVAAHQAREVVLPSAVGSSAVTLHLTSDVPVAAAVRVAPGVGDFARAEATAALDGSAAVPLGLEGSGRVPELLLAGTARRSSRVVLTAYDASMKRIDTATVTVGAGQTRQVDLARALTIDDAAYVVVRGAGDVVGSAVYRRGGAIAALGLRAAPVTALGPHVDVVGP